ncbi:protein XRI1-like isoform X3 [Olea europaea var. sylvestris]|uniref:protein XRI1-like isoform X3 n=1 Tax=Olea europaea var. sylvestris TaxID=158386 RepID=UPI000C1D8B58|nr:protein XRI1-like isoform X3 [Olea europaea var. sylvestris]
MDYNNDSQMWDWQSQAYSLEENTSLDIPECLMNGVNENEDLSYMFDNETTPVKACGDLAYHVTSYEITDKELEKRGEPSSQVKRRRILQFESEVSDAPLCKYEAFLRSKETPESLEVASSEISQLVDGFTGTFASSNECLDPSSEGWLANCFIDPEMQYKSEDIRSVSGTSDVQNDITELFDAPPEYEASAVQKLPIRPCKSIVFKGRKSYMQTPSKVASSVVYPFAFVKPCSVHGDVTLKDINQRIHTPSESEENNEDHAVSYPTSAISGKPIVGKTKIRTEGGKGCITITRTKG